MNFLPSVIRYLAGKRQTSDNIFNEVEIVYVGGVWFPIARLKPKDSLNTDITTFQPPPEKCRQKKNHNIRVLDYNNNFD